MAANQGSIKDCYYAGKLTDTSGGYAWISSIVGYNTGTITNCYWDIDKSGTGTAIYSGTKDGAGVTVTGLGLTNRYAASSYNGWDLASEGGTSRTWRIYEGQTLPLLRSFLTPLTVSAGSVTKTYDGNVFTIVPANVTYSPASAASDPLLEGMLSYGNGNEKNAGTYYLTGLYSTNNLGYDVSYSGALTINQKTLNIAWQTPQAPMERLLIHR